MRKAELTYHLHAKHAGFANEDSNSTSTPRKRAKHGVPVSVQRDRLSAKDFQHIEKRFDAEPEPEDSEALDPSWPANKVPDLETVMQHRLLTYGTANPDPKQLWMIIQHCAEAENHLLDDPEYMKGIDLRTWGAEQDDGGHSDYQDDDESNADEDKDESSENEKDGNEDDDDEGSTDEYHDDEDEDEDIHEHDEESGTSIEGAENRAFVAESHSGDPLSTDVETIFIDYNCSTLKK